MAHVKNLDAFAIHAPEHDPVIAHAETELESRRLEPDDVARASGQIMIDCVQDAKSSLAINGSQLGPCIW